MSVTLTIEGLDRWMDVCDPNRYLKEIDLGMRQSSAMLRDEAKKMPPVSAKRTGYAVLGLPVDSGLTRQRIVSKKNGPLDYSDVAETNYSGFLHEGTSKMPARPFFYWLLHDFDGIEKVETILTTSLTRVASPR